MSARMRSIADKVWPYVLLGVLCAAFFWRIWTPNPLDRASFAAGDFSGQFYAFARYQAERVWSGQLPLWNPYAAAGHPFLADIQSATFYPPRWVSILLSGPGGFTYFALELEAIAHVFLAGAFTYAFARRIFADRAAAFSSAIVFAFGGYLASYPILQLAILETIAWLPLILLLIDWAFTASLPRKRFAATIGAGLIWGISLLAGHPQTAMHVVYFALIFGAWRAHSQRARWTEAAVRLSAVMLIGLGAAAAQWIPSLEFMQQSARGSLGYDALAGGFPLHDAAQVLLPGTTSVWSPLYIGILPLSLAVLSGFSQRRNTALFWLVAAGTAFVLSLGGATFLYNLLYQWVPGFGLFRSQERLAGVTSFALAVAAGGGIALLRSADHAVSAGKLRRVLQVILAGLILMCGALFALWQAAGQAPDVAATLDRSLFALLLVALTLGLLQLRRTSLGNRPVWSLLVLALIAFDLFTVNWQTDLEQRSPDDYAPAPGFIEIARADPDLARVDGRGLFDGNWGSAIGVPTVDGISPLAIRRYGMLRDALRKEREWALFNVKYVADAVDQLAVPSEVIAQEIWQGRTLNLFRLTNPTPRAWIVHRVRVLDDASALPVLADPAFDLRAEAIVSEPVAVVEASAPSSARVAEYLPERVLIDVEASAAGLLVLSELDYPGWRASLDGAEAPAVRANVALRAVAVPAGRHRVEFVFQPASVSLGLAVSGAAWGIGLIGIVWARIRRRRSGAVV